MNIQELTDFETEEKIELKDCFLIQHPENGEIFAYVSNKTHNERIREVLRERYGLDTDIQDPIYGVYRITEERKILVNKISKDMLEKGFPRVFEYFKTMNYVN